MDWCCLHSGYIVHSQLISSIPAQAYPEVCLLRESRSWQVSISIARRISGLKVFTHVSFPSLGCHSSCRSCQNGGPFSCSSCDTGLVLTHIGTCSTTCFPGHYLDDNQVCQRKFNELSPLLVLWAFGRNVKCLLHLLLQWPLVNMRKKANLQRQCGCH